MAHLKFTKLSIEKLPLTNSGQKLYWDTELQGFGLIVGKTMKSYVAQGNINNKSVRVTIGKHGVFTCDEARAEARTKLNEIARGINPIIKEKAAREKGITLNEVFEAFIKSRKLKPNTVYDYKGDMNRAFNDWMHLPISSITKDMICDRHASISKEIAKRKKEPTGHRGEAHANGVMRVFRAVYNFALAKYESAHLPENPVRALSQRRAWNKDRRRQTIITMTQLPAWFKAVSELSDPLAQDKAETVRDYLLLILFTGLRRAEAGQLTWSCIDLEGKTLTIKETKNGETHSLPLPDYLCKLLEARKKVSKSVFVFPWPEVKQGHIIDAERYREALINASGVDFIIHDLRRTFITIAERLDISSYAVKRLVNHKMSGDVTAGYIIADVERLRKPMERIADYILSTVGKKTKAEVIPIKQIRKVLNK